MLALAACLCPGAQASSQAWGALLTCRVNAAGVVPRHRRPWIIPCAFSSCSDSWRCASFDRLERRCQRLKSFLKRLELPAKSHFVAEGKLYSLPLRAGTPSEASGEPSQDELDFCAGFFDGDGCAYSDADFLGRVLSVGQAARNGAVLLKFLSLLGGTIIKGRPTKGHRQATLLWKITGDAMRSAASRLSTAALCKRDQLDIAAMELPDCPMVRAWQAARMRALKREAPRQPRLITWAYLAGLFDAEGCISTRPTGMQIVLIIAQKRAEVLCCARTTMQRSFPGIDVYIRCTKAGCHVLSISRTASARVVLKRLLFAGLVVRRQQAVLVLSMHRHRHTSFRYKLSSLKGNQAHTILMDADGCARAHKIKLARGRLRHSVRTGGANGAELQAELESLQMVHKLKKLENRAALLRRDARRLLKEGARVSSR